MTVEIVIMTRDEVLTVIVAIRDCSLIETWEAQFHQPYLDNADVRLDPWAYDAHKSMWRAALLFSLIALRKVADFAENRGTKQDDIRLSSFNLDLMQITGKTEVIDRKLRTKIDKGIAHLTTKLDPDYEELDELREKLRSKDQVLQDLGDKFFSMI